MAVVGTAQYLKSVVGEFGPERQSMTAYFAVTVNSESDGPFTVSKAPGLPSNGSLWAWGSDAGMSGILATRKDLRCKRDGKMRFRWIVEAPYEWGSQSSASTPPGSGQGGLRDQQGNPVEDPADAYCRLVPGFVTYTEVAEDARYLGVKTPIGETTVPGWTKDKRMPVCNSAGVPVIPGKERQIGRLALRITKWFSPWEDVLTESILHINDKDLTIKYQTGGVIMFERMFPARTLLCYAITVQDTWHSTGRLWYVVTAELHFNEQTWVHNELDQGYLVKVAPGESDGLGGTFSTSDFTAVVPEYRRLLDVRGRPVNQKMLFDGKGKLLTSPLPENANYIRFLVQEETDLSLLTRAFFL